MPGLGKDAGAKIIGETSGGGTSPVGVYFDALGTNFNISNLSSGIYIVRVKTKHDYAEKVTYLKLVKK